MTLIVDTLAGLATELDLECQTGKSPDGLPEVYLFSHDMRYRYAFARSFARRWDDGPMVLWVMLNPATGDTEKRRRPTLERCIARSLVVGGSGIIIANLFAARHTKPRDMRADLEPVGSHNDAVLHALSGLADKTFVAWGAGATGRLKSRVARVVQLLRQPLCLGVTADGQPLHPLFVPASVVATPWRPDDLFHGQKRGRGASAP